jgi:hypothetical protein
VTAVSIPLTRETCGVVFSGRYRFVLEDDHVRIVPKRSWRRSDGVVIRYLDIASMLTVEPRRGDRGAFVLRLTDGSEISIPFAKRATLRMRTVHHHLRK